MGGRSGTESVALGDLPFDGLRANGESITTFVVSPSNHGPATRAHAVRPYASTRTPYPEPRTLFRNLRQREVRPLLHVQPRVLLGVAEAVGVAGVAVDAVCKEFAQLLAVHALSNLGRVELH